MRTNLITTFHCFDCGKKLEVDYGEGVKTESPYSQGDPTGAAVMYSKVVVKPCRSCIEKHTGPARKLAEAIKELNP